MKKLLFIAALTALMPALHGAASSSSESNQPAAATRHIRSLQDLAVESFTKGALEIPQEKRGKITKMLPGYGVKGLDKIIIDQMLKDRSEVFATKESLRAELIKRGIPDYIFEQIPLSIIAREYYLHVKGDRAKMPLYLQEAFNAYLKEPGAGFSIQDLIDNKMMPAIEYNQYYIIGNNVLNLLHQYINSLEGLQNIPGIENVTKLDLNFNRLTVIELRAFEGLNKLEELYLCCNRLTDAHPDAFAGLNHLQELYLSQNQLTDETKARIRQEVQEIAPNAEVGF